MKCVLSLTKEGMHGTSVLIHRSTKAEVFSVAHPFPEMIGLPGGMPRYVHGLCILGLW